MKYELNYYLCIPQYYYLLLSSIVLNMFTLLEYYDIIGSSCLLSFVKMSAIMHCSITNATLHPLVLLFSLMSTKCSYLYVHNVSIF